MKKWRLFIPTLALVAAACGGGDQTVATQAPAVQTDGSTTSTSSSGSDSTAAPSDDGVAGDTTTTAAELQTGPDGPAAPDFTMALADGSSFTLSAEQKPVYMVFWAEW